MEFEIIPETTEVIELVTTYRTKLRVDNKFDITVKFIEIYATYEEDETVRDIRVEIEEFPEDEIPIISEFQILVDETIKFVENNTDMIIKGK